MDLFTNITGVSSQTVKSLYEAGEENTEYKGIIDFCMNDYEVSDSFGNGMAGNGIGGNGFDDFGGNGFVDFDGNGYEGNGYDGNGNGYDGNGFADLGGNGAYAEYMNSLSEDENDFWQA